MVTQKRYLKNKKFYMFLFARRFYNAMKLYLIMCRPLMMTADNQPITPSPRKIYNSSIIMPLNKLSNENLTNSIFNNNTFNNSVESKSHSDISNRNSKTIIFEKKIKYYKQPETCFIVYSNTYSSKDSDSDLKNAEKLVESIKYSYNKNFAGFSFCGACRNLINALKTNFKTLEIEEEKIYTIGSVKNDKRIKNKNKNKNLYPRENEGKIYQLENNISNTFNTYIQYSIPMHFFRLFNMGGLIFNNYLLDNIVFQILRINFIFKIFYRYKYRYAGNKITITVIDTDYIKKCNEHSEIISSLLVGIKNSFAKHAILKNIGEISCNGTITLSKLLAVLEDLETTDILFLPFSGPHSAIINRVLNRIGVNTIVIASAGNDGNNSCNYSPDGSNIIKVGSANKHGYVSSFSNHGGCNKVYTLGEHMLGDDGTSYSGALVASAVAVFLSYKPGSSLYEVERFIKAGSARNADKDLLFKMPNVENYENGEMYYYYNPLTTVLIVFIIIILIAAICYSIWYLYKLRLIYHASDENHSEEVNTMIQYDNELVY